MPVKCFLSHPQKNVGLGCENVLLMKIFVTKREELSRDWNILRG